MCLYGQFFMKYIVSNELKEKEIHNNEITVMVPWIVLDGSFDRVLKTHFSGGNKDRRSILDIGCGGGSTLVASKDYFSNFSGIDIVDERANDLPIRIDFSKVDLNFEKLPFPDSAFDMVTAFQTIEHLENPFFVMREAKRVLKPDGLFMLSVPNPYHISFKMKYLFTSNMPPWTEFNNHLTFLTKDVFKKTYLKEFDLVEVIHQRGSVPFWGRLRMIFGKKLISKHNMILPRSEWFGRRIGFLLKKSR